MQSLFLGTFENRIDSKGRVLVPAAFRQPLSQDGQPGLVCYPDINQTALEGVSLRTLNDSFNALREQYEMYSPEYEAVMSILSGAANLSWDSGGRVQLPERLLKKAGIRSDVVFVGLGDRFRIWDPNLYQKHLGVVAKITEKGNITISLASARRDGQGKAE